jgi:hypothetical protein
LTVDVVELGGETSGLGADPGGVIAAATYEAPTVFGTDDKPTTATPGRVDKPSTDDKPTTATPGRVDKPSTDTPGSSRGG